MGCRSRARGAAVVIIDFPVKSDCELKLQSERPKMTNEVMALRGRLETIHLGHAQIHELPRTHRPRHLTW
jgi:hypothetical protein